MATKNKTGSAKTEARAASKSTSTKKAAISGAKVLTGQYLAASARPVASKPSQTLTVKLRASRGLALDKIHRVPSSEPLALKQAVQEVLSWQKSRVASSSGLWTQGAALGRMSRLASSAGLTAPPTAKKVPAKKAASTKAVKLTSRTGKNLAATRAGSVPVSAVEVAQLLLLLQARLRSRQLQQESVSVGDLVVLRPGSDKASTSAQVQTLAELKVGKLERLKGLAVAQGDKKPKLDVVRQLDGSLVVKARPQMLRAIHHASPGLKIIPATYAYLQHLMPLGEAIQDAQIQVAPGTIAKKFAVLVQDEDGQPVVGVTVRAMVDWDGAHISATTDAQGFAQLRLPTVYPEVTLLMVEPEHTHWSKFALGFRRVDAPPVTAITLRRLMPDGFKLLGHYAPYDESAGKGVTVGIIDSGVGPHDDLTVSAGACLVTGEAPTAFEDNGIGHGTHVAGIIGARLSAGGTYGLAPAARLLSYRVCPKSGNKGRSTSVDIAAAIEMAVQQGCDLINLSMGSVEAMPEVPDMLELARAAGAVVIAATGNDGLDHLRYPARYSNTVAVGAMGRDGAFPDDSSVSSQESEIRRKSEWVAEFSNYGTGTDFIGPGVAVISTFPGNRYAMMSGTSMSTPFTTGMAARLLSAHPSVFNMNRGPERADAIIRMLMDNIREIGWDAKYGIGVLK